MASVVIVTSQCYLLAEAINYIVINEDNDSDDNQWRPKTAKDRKLRHSHRVKRDYILERKPFNIVINFIPKGNPQQHASSSKHNSDDSSTVSLTVHGLQRCLKVFQDIVSQLREQIPDERFLDTLVARFLADVEEEDKMISKMGLK